MLNASELFKMSKSLWWNPVVVIKLVLIKKILLILKVSIKEKKVLLILKLIKAKKKKWLLLNFFP